MEQAPVPAVPEADPSAAGGASPETGSSGASTTDSPPEAVAVPAQTEDPAAAPVAALTPAAEAGDAATAAAPPVPSPAPEAALPAPAGPSGPGGPPIDGDDAEEDEDGGGGKMSFLDHLDELRTRLIASFGALAVGFIVCFGFIDPIFDFIMEPLTDVLEEGGTLIYTDATEAFFLRLKMAALAGLVIATPVIMSQLWLFIAPGLYAHEKKFAIPFVALASMFFVGGAFFGHYVLFRVAWGFFGSFGSATEYLEFTPRIQPAFSLYVRLVLACGVIFQLPTIVFFLARMGVASSGFLIRNFKYAFLLCFVIAAILTPTPDPVTMTVMAGPMLALYVLSIGIAWVFQKRRTD
jgi:sec-independent protein translocase protein TatC